MLKNVEILPKILSLSGENLKKPYFLQKNAGLIRGADVKKC